MGVFNAEAAPATVSGEPVPQSHWGKPGKAVPGGDPRARRPTVGSRVRRAGCLGVGCVLRGLPHPYPLTKSEMGQTAQAPEPGADALKTDG